MTTPEDGMRRSRATALRGQLDRANDDLRSSSPERVARAQRDLILISGSALALVEELLDVRRFAGNAPGEASGRLMRPT